jgi:hypothetical protein
MIDSRRIRVSREPRPDDRFIWCTPIAVMTSQDDQRICAERCTGAQQLERTPTDLRKPRLEHGSVSREQRLVVAGREEQEDHPVDPAVTLLQGESPIQGLQIVRVVSASTPTLHGSPDTGSTPRISASQARGSPGAGNGTSVHQTSDRWHRA